MKKKGLILLSGIMLLGALSAGGCEKRKLRTTILDVILREPKNPKGNWKAFLRTVSYR